MNSYLDSYLCDTFMRGLFKPEKPVRHQQTCPSCGKMLVNTYRRGDEWKCLECWNIAAKSALEQEGRNE